MDVHNKIKTRCFIQCTSENEYRNSANNSGKGAHYNGSW